MSLLRLPLYLLLAAVYAAAFGQDQQLHSLIEKAQAAEQRDDLAAAASAYQEILRLKPNWGSAELNLALVLNSQKKYRDALAYFDHALQHDATLSSAHLGRGVSLFNLERFEDAVASLQQYAGARPEDPEVHLLLGRTLDSLGAYSRAIMEFQRQLQLTPQNTEALYHLGESGRTLSGVLAKQLADDPDGVYYFTLLTAEEPQLSQDIGSTESKIGDAIRSHPDRPEAYVTLGLLQLRAGNRKEAASAFQEAWQRDSTDCRISSTCSDDRDAAAGFDGVSTPAACYDRFQRAKRLAESSFRKLVDIAPQSPLAAQARAHLWDQSGRLEEADEQYRKAVELALRSPESLVGYAKFLAKRGQFDRSIALLREALRGEPSSSVIQALLGEMHVMKDEPSAAIPYLKAALGHRPNDEQTRYYLAQALARLNRAAEAVAVIEAATADPQGRLHYLLGTLYRRLGQPVKAERAFEVFRQRKAAR